MSEPTEVDFAAIDGIKVEITYGGLRSYMMNAFALGRASAGGCEECEHLKQLAEAQAKLDREEADCLAVIRERDAHEDRLNKIFAALRMEEYDASWTSMNDPSERALEYIADAQTRAVAPGSIVYEPDGEPRQVDCGEYYTTGSGLMYECSTLTDHEWQVYKRRVV